MTGNDIGTTDNDERTMEMGDRMKKEEVAKDDGGRTRGGRRLREEEMEGAVSSEEFASPVITSRTRVRSRVGSCPIPSPANSVVACTGMK